MSISSKQGLVVSVAALFVGITGCSAAPTSEESYGSTTSKLLAPQPSVMSAASAETTAKYGITHWKIFRGKQNMVMTGYDEKNHAVKGVTLGFAQSNEGGAQLVTQIDDGSSFTAVHDFARCQNLSPQPLSSDSQAFITALASDATTIQQLFDARAQTTSSPDAQCGADMAAVLTKALQCMSGSTSTATQASCITAAQKAYSSAASCQYTGTTSTNGSTTAPSSTPSSAASSTPSSAATSGSSSSGSVLASLPSYTPGQSPFDAGELESTIANVLSNPYVSGGGCDISSPFGDGALANILGSFSNGDCSYSAGGESPFAAFSASDLCAFGGFGGGDY